MVEVDLRMPSLTEDDQISQTTIGEVCITAAGTAATTTDRSLLHRKPLTMDQWKVLLAKD